MTIEQLKQRAVEAQAVAKEAWRAYENALKAEFPFQPGDIIKSRTGILARVHTVKMEYGSPRAVAHLQKKDGSFGKREASMWHADWSKPALHEKAPA